MVDRADLVEWPPPDVEPARLPLSVYVEAAIDGLRVVVAVAATAWFTLVFWYPINKWRDGPPEIDEIVWKFQIPLALGLTCAGSLLVRSRGYLGLLGLVCLMILVPAFIEIVVASLGGAWAGSASGVWVYCQG